MCVKHFGYLSRDITPLNYNFEHIQFSIWLMYDYEKWICKNN